MYSNQHRVRSTSNNWARFHKLEAPTGRGLIFTSKGGKGNVLPGRTKLSGQTNFEQAMFCRPGERGTFRLEHLEGWKRGCYSRTLQAEAWRTTHVSSKHKTRLDLTTTNQFGLPCVRQLCDSYARSHFQIDQTRSLRDEPGD